MRTFKPTLTQRPIFYSLNHVIPLTEVNLGITIQHSKYSRSQIGESREPMKETINLAQIVEYAWATAPNLSPVTLVANVASVKTLLAMSPVEHSF
jgi:hypothetical protein